MKEILKKIALNCAVKPNRGLAYENDLTQYDTLTRLPWLAKKVEAIRNGNDALKDELPIRCSHYYRFRDNHRRQADMDPEAFLFQTCVDIDDLEAVEPAIARAYLLDKEQGGQLQTLGWSSICQVRKDRIERHISDEEQAESCERLLASIA